MWQQLIIALLVIGAAGYVVWTFLPMMRRQRLLDALAACGVLAVVLLLLYEHSLVKADDLSKLNAAFFTMNGIISVLFFVFVAGDLLLRK